MTTISTMSAPMASRGFVAKAGALTAGTVLAGAALFGGAVVAPTVTTSSFAASVQQEFGLTAFPTFTDSLQSLLTALDLGTMGQVLGLFGTEASPINTASELSALLAALNPDGASLNDITGGLLSQDLTALLDGVQMGGTTLGDAPIDGLIGGFIGGAGANESIGDVLTQLGLGPYVGLLDLPFAGLSPDDTVAELLNGMLGITATTSINDLLTANGLGDTTIAGLLGIDPTQDWDLVVDSIKLGSTIMDPTGTGVLGDMTLGALLTSLLGAGADPVLDSTTVTDFLGGLDLFTMLGLS